jgi:hypothetical protein
MNCNLLKGGASTQSPFRARIEKNNEDSCDSALDENSQGSV